MSENGVLISVGEDRVTLNMRNREEMVVDSMMRRHCELAEELRNYSHFLMFAYMLTHMGSSRDIWTFISDESSLLVICSPMLCKIVSHMTSYSRTFLLVHLPIFLTRHHMLTHFLHVLLIVWFLIWDKHGLCATTRIVYIDR